jgi:CheY-like chemotaxis protein
MEATSPASPGGLETVLLAEDEAGVRALLANQLSVLGYRVISASNGEEALSMARSFPGSIQLLVSDLVMPKLGGRELTSELRKVYPELRVILISGYAGHHPDGPETSLPGDCLLGKPFSMRELAQTVRRVLDSTPR